MKVAIIGTGISGLSAAWLLNQTHDITVFEAESRIGGHANTVEIEGHPAIDAGFSVFNEHASPNFSALLEYFKIPKTKIDMSFAVSMFEGRYEYSNHALFSRFSNYLNVRHGQILFDAMRFYKAIEKTAGFDEGVLLGGYLKQKHYSRAFIERHIQPLATALLGAEFSQAPLMTMQHFAQLIRAQGSFLYDMNADAQWHTIGGGTRHYVEALSASFQDKIRLNAKITDVIRHRDFVEVVQQGGKTDQFEQVVLAVHSDQAHALLSRLTKEETTVLSAFPSRKIKAYLHQDERLMPVNKKVWSGWNFMQDDMDRNEPHMTLWMNRLQPFVNRGQNYFVTLNPPYIPQKTLLETTYKRPQYLKSALAGWAGISSIQGVNRTWFCGAWCGHGLHEDALSAGLSVGEALGGNMRPWAANEKSPAEDNCTPIFE